MRWPFVALVLQSCTCGKSHPVTTAIETASDAPAASASVVVAAVPVDVVDVDAGAVANDEKQSMDDCLVAHGGAIDPQTGRPNFAAAMECNRLLGPAADAHNLESALDKETWTSFARSAAGVDGFGSMCQVRIESGLNDETGYDKKRSKRFPSWASLASAIPLSSSNLADTCTASPYPCFQNRCTPQNDVGLLWPVKEHSDNEPVTFVASERAFAIFQWSTAYNPNEGQRTPSARYPSLPEQCDDAYPKVERLHDRELHARVCIRSAQSMEPKVAMACADYWLEPRSLRPYFVVIESSHTQAKSPGTYRINAFPWSFTYHPVSFTDTDVKVDGCSMTLPLPMALRRTRSPPP